MNFVIRKIPVEPFGSPLGVAGIALLVLGALTRSWAAGYIRKAKALATVRAVRAVRAIRCTSVPRSCSPAWCAWCRTC
ncbi:MAG: hypothetical protein MZV65_19520 [Chromatiales bacterium]|nr:hypothetical protein [Chromatiales bacterium]